MNLFEQSLFVSGKVTKQDESLGYALVYQWRFLGRDLCMGWLFFLGLKVMGGF